MEDFLHYQSRFVCSDILMSELFLSCGPTLPVGATAAAAAAARARAVARGRAEGAAREAASAHEPPPAVFESVLLIRNPAYLCSWVSRGIGANAYGLGVNNEGPDFFCLLSFGRFVQF